MNGHKIIIGLLLVSVGVVIMGGHPALVIIALGIGLLFVAFLNYLDNDTKFQDVDKEYQKTKNKK